MQKSYAVSRKQSILSELKDQIQMQRSDSGSPDTRHLLESHQAYVLKSGKISPRRMSL